MVAGGGSGGHGAGYLHRLGVSFVCYKQLGSFGADICGCDSYSRA